MNINVHIERLVLEGLPVTDPDSPIVQAAIETELARIVAGHFARIVHELDVATDRQPPGVPEEREQIVRVEPRRRLAAAQGSIARPRPFACSRGCSSGCSRSRRSSAPRCWSTCSSSAVR